MYTTQARNRHLVIIVGLAVLIYALTAFLNQGSVNMAGEYINPKQVNQAVLISLFISFPILGFVLGALGAFIPFKGLNYRQKYLRASLISIIIIYALLLIRLLFTYL